MNAPGIRRRLFLGSAVGAFALRPSCGAQADTTFTNFSFAATGAPTARTMPERLSDVINVKDWGAKGNQTANDTRAVQNAIDYCIARGGGIVFFPAGIYALQGGALTVGSSNPNAGVQLVGSGMACTGITAGVNGFVISKGAAQYDNIRRVEGISILNGATTANTGCIKLTGTGVSILNVYFTGMVGLDASQANSVSVYDCNGQSNEVLDRAANGNNRTPGISVGMYLGNNCTAVDCRLSGGYFITFALSGTNANLITCSSEGVNIAVRVGWSPSGETPANGCMVTNFQTERDNIAFELYNAHGCLLNANYFTGHAGLNDPMAIAGGSWSSANGGSATITTSAPHNLQVGLTQALQISGIGYPTPWRPTYALWCTATGPNTFTYSLPQDPGIAYPRNTTWTFMLKYAIRCRVVTESAIIGNSLQAFNGAYGSVDLDYYNPATGQHEAQHRNNVFVNHGAKWGWVLPTNRYNLAGWHFISCGSYELDPSAAPGNVAVPTGQMVFADLPGNFAPVGSPTYWPDGPIEGQEFDIKDGSLYGRTPPYLAGWNDQVTGGGNGHYKARYDGVSAVWRRIG